MAQSKDYTNLAVEGTSQDGSAFERGARHPRWRGGTDRATRRNRQRTYRSYGIGMLLSSNSSAETSPSSAVPKKSTEAEFWSSKIGTLNAYADTWSDAESYIADHFPELKVGLKQVESIRRGESIEMVTAAYTIEIISSNVGSDSRFRLTIKKILPQKIEAASLLAGERSKPRKRNLITKLRYSGMTYAFRDAKKAAKQKAKKLRK
jgi:hypothetical protein